MTNYVYVFVHIIHLYLNVVTQYQTKNKSFILQNCIIYNIYILVFIALSLLLIPINFYGIIGFIVQMEDAVNEIKLIQILHVHMHSFLPFMKIGVCIYNADKILDLLDVTRINFIKSSQFFKHLKVFYEYGKSSIKINNILYFLLKIIILSWMIFPLLSNMNMLMKTFEKRTLRYENIQSLRF